MAVDLTEAVPTVEIAERTAVIPTVEIAALTVAGVRARPRVTEAATHPRASAVVTPLLAADRTVAVRPTAVADRTVAAVGRMEAVVVADMGGNTTLASFRA